ncbi:MAG: prepilin-type N-terminal cleavage/methylation domain-containing protein [Candidatus Gracilibacteria bacterium]|nr:prepilin-type N-terminal cleavage/methylation domain-containing protein [Candidatus Gracilibacteria bacterium]
MKNNNLESRMQNIEFRIMTKDKRLNFLNNKFCQLNSTKKAFTLVELIVTIVIIIILGAVSFISFTGYVQNSRDSARIADISNIRKNLELLMVTSGKYPLPDGPIKVTYEGDLVRTQGIVGDNMIHNLKNLSKKPLDPKTGLDYIYSTTFYQTEYELLGVFEGTPLTYNSFLHQANARGKDKYFPKIEGTYNGVIVKTTNYIVPTPTIINAELPINGEIVLDSESIKSQVVTGGDNMVALGNQAAETGALDDFNLYVYSGSTTNLTYAQKQAIASNIISAYSGTSLVGGGGGTYSEILGSSSSSYVNVVDNLLSVNTYISSNTSNCNGGTKVGEKYPLVTYSYPNINHGRTGVGTGQILITNGEKNYTSDIKCYNGATYISNENENLVCNNWLSVPPICNTAGGYTYSSTYKQCVHYSTTPVQNPTTCKVYLYITFNSFCADDGRAYNLTVAPGGSVGGSRCRGFVFAGSREVRDSFSVKFDNTCTITSYTMGGSTSSTCNILPGNSATCWNPITNNSTYTCPAGYSIYSGTCRSNTPDLYATPTCSNGTFDADSNSCKYVSCN